MTPNTKHTWNALLWGAVAGVIAYAGPPLLVYVGAEGGWKASLVVPLTVVGRFLYRYAESKYK